MNLNQIDVIVPDVPRSARMLARLFDVEPDEVGDRFAQLTLDAMTIMLSPDALVPMGEARGVILHVEVDESVDAEERARAAGAQILRPTTRTDWGTVSTLIAGPGGVVIDLYRG